LESAQLPASSNRVLADSGRANGSVLAKTVKRRVKTKPAIKKSGVSQLLTLLSVVIAIVAGVISYQFEGDSGLAIGVVIATFILANIGITLLASLLAPLFSLLKTPVVMVLLVAAAIVVGNMAEIGIAQDLFTFLESIITQFIQ